MIKEIENLYEFVFRDHPFESQKYESALRKIAIRYMIRTYYTISLELIGKIEGDVFGGKPTSHSTIIHSVSEYQKWVGNYYLAGIIKEIRDFIYSTGDIVLAEPDTEMQVDHLRRMEQELLKEKERISEKLFKTRKLLEAI